MFMPDPSRLKVIDAEVFGQVPDRLHITGRVSQWARLQHGTDEIGVFLEGPVLGPAGSLFVTDLAWGRIFEFGSDGSVSVCLEYDGEPNGLAFHPDGRLVIADFRQGLLVADLAAGTIEPLLIRSGYDRFRGVNDLNFDAAGNLYFTDQGGSDLQSPTGKVFRLRPDGVLQPVLEGAPSPNGLVFDQQQSILYVAMTRDNALWRLQWTPDGRTRAGRWVQLSGGVGPDGLEIDDEGRVYAAHLGLGIVWVFDRRGIAVGAIRSPVGDAVTNVHIDRDSGTAYITESISGCVLRADIRLFDQ
jgi:gluconolactonase